MAWDWWKGFGCMCASCGHPNLSWSTKKIELHTQLLIIFVTNFMLLRGQMWITKHNLQISTTLARFGDPLWCIKSQPTGRMWFCVQHWSPDEPKTMLGTPFENINFFRWCEFKFVFTWVMLHNLITWTLFLLVCLWTHCEGPSNGHTWCLHVNLLSNYAVMHDHVRNYTCKIMNFH